MRRGFTLLEPLLWVLSAAGTLGAVLTHFDPRHDPLPWAAMPTLGPFVLMGLAHLPLPGVRADRGAWAVRAYVALGLAGLVLCPFWPHPLAFALRGLALLPAAFFDLLPLLLLIGEARQRWGNRRR